MIEYAIGAGLAYAAVDFITGLYYGRCVLPGLKCRECRRGA